MSVDQKVISVGMSEETALLDKLDDAGRAYKRNNRSEDARLRYAARHRHNCRDFAVEADKLG